MLGAFGWAATITSLLTKKLGPGTIYISIRKGDVNNHDKTVVDISVIVVFLVGRDLEFLERIHFYQLSHDIIHHRN